MYTAYNAHIASCIVSFLSHTPTVLHRIDYYIVSYVILSCSSPSLFRSVSTKLSNIRKIAAIVGSVGVTVYGVLVAEYSFPGKEEEDHVFSHVQASFRGAMDQYVYGILPSSSTTDTGRTRLEQQQQQQQQQQQSPGNTNQPGDR
jgi:hypothetical protein